MVCELIDRQPRDAIAAAGWLKVVNSNSLDADKDGGRDSENFSSDPNGKVAKDAYGYSLGYFNNDYTPINSALSDQLASISGSGFEGATHDLFNGNIRHMITSLTDLSGNQMKIQGTAYNYDQLNRLKQMNAYSGNNIANLNSFNSANDNNNYLTMISYDANGNIDTLIRNGATPGNPKAMDNMVYRYEEHGGKKLNNRLLHVDDAVNPGNYPDDIDDQGTFDETEPGTWNYKYDETGNLTRDMKEEILNIEWTTYGKIKHVERTGNAHNKPDMVFKYDGNGNRVMKLVKPRVNGVLQTQEAWDYTYYVRDASGNVMAIYHRNLTLKAGNPLTATDLLLATENPVYGSGRLGIEKRNIMTGSLQGIVSNSPNSEGEYDFQGGAITSGCGRPIRFSRKLGNKNYELTNHLGNVHVVVSDRKLGVDSDGDGMIDYYTADIRSATDYYPFGSPQPGRTFNLGNYRYGHGSQEMVNEISGAGNHYTAMFWEMDPRLGRRWNLDPKPNTSISQYAIFANNPIWYSDLLGDTTKAGNWMRKNLPGLIAAPLGGITDFFGGLGKSTAGVFTGDKAKVNKGLSDAGMGLLGSVGLAEAFTQKWKTGPTGGFLPESLSDEVADVGSKVPPDAWKNGMHAWHAGTNAALTHRLGPVGAVLTFAGGVIHETPLDWQSFKAEQRYQGTWNHIMDSSTDIIANTFGITMGLLLPKKAAINVSMKLGNQIPGPGDPDPAFGGGGGYTFPRAWDAWLQVPSWNP